MEGPDLFEEEEGEKDEDGGKSHEANVEEYKDGGEGEDNGGRDGGKAGDEPETRCQRAGWDVPQPYDPRGP